MLYAMDRTPSAARSTSLPRPGKTRHGWPAASTSAASDKRSQQSGNPHRPPAAAHRILTVFVVIPMRRSGYHSASIMSLLAHRRNGPKITRHKKVRSGDEGNFKREGIYQL